MVKVTLTLTIYLVIINSNAHRCISKAKHAAQI